MSGADDSYLFDRERPRFEPAPDDALVSAPDLEIVAAETGIRVLSKTARADFEIANVTPRAAREVLSAIDGRATWRELEARAPDPGDVRAVIRACFGVVLFAPLAVERLERALSGTEITRFPGSPYEIVRSYWQNMIAVRAECSRIDGALETVERFTEFLRELNVLALTGADGKTIYAPASPIARRGVAPGALLTNQAKTVETDAGTLFISGPRVNVKAIGGEHYHRVLYERAGDPAAIDAAREIVRDGLAWGRVVRARAESDPDFGDWFCAPRPIQAAHFEVLRASLAASLEAAGSDAAQTVLGHLARFHWHFVRLHPFFCANQSLAMNLVNFVLVRARGAGIPHLILDQLALRLDLEAYERVFETAVGAFLMSGAGPVTRYTELRARRLRAFALIEKLAGAPSLEAARALAKSAGADARLALIVAER